jgi:tRNA threonylcarbamoyladenosine biosynthesis protein TsaB
VKILAVDTSDARGSVALFCGADDEAIRLHASNEDYSSWLLPAVASLAPPSQNGGGSAPRTAAVLAVCSGPGSFTGLRVGLTTVKAWAEVYSKPIVSVSRLEAMASRVTEDGYVAACYDAQRGHIFAGIYRRTRGELARVDQEMVASPEEFLGIVSSTCGRESVFWISLDPGLITGQPDWPERRRLGDTLTVCSPDLARSIGKIAQQRARANLFTDVLALDANYVRRSDAEILWKGR